MSKKDIKAKVVADLSSGAAKSEVFSRLSGQGIKDSQLAYFIAAYADARLCDEHSRKVDNLVFLMVAQSLLAAIIGYGVGAHLGPNAKWVVGALLALIPILFAWGFYKHYVGMYNGYIFLAIIQLPQSLKGFMATPIASSVGIAIGAGVLAYVWYVRGKIFPDFAFFSPRKIKGKYVFSCN
ncbi:hypothetical protein DIC66_12690 [Rhodoferax lacus]|uniref:Permease n=1 Tax=Rhodoferax lacus TaxID=2184758 RepID=A0A3E1RBK1_9BURK|nr:hypothetical protein [Rhodoferax lacus]RFO96601.1 hypothetical protein DIC66_12690 [Rhodoferax lacus]